MKERIFISSAQKELAVERRALKDYVHGDPLLGRFFEVFLFEDVPAADRRADDVYLEEVDRCDVYVGLFGDEYGREDLAGLSATEREFDRASAKSKIRLVFVKGADDARMHPKMQALVRKAGDQLIRRRFNGMPDLAAGLYASLIEHLTRTGALRSGPFDAAVCAAATAGDLSPDRVRRFLRTAREQRRFALDEDSSVEEALTHLNLLDRGRPNHAAILLFGRDPQRFLAASELKCLHFHGVEVRKPIPSYQIYKGTVFDLVDQAADFVLSKIARAVGTRQRSAQAPPAPASRSCCSPTGLKSGIPALCREAGLPEPEFRQDAGQVMVTLRRDWLTGEALERLGFNGRQRQAVAYARRMGRIDNAQYRELTKAIRKTASRDLDELVRKGVLAKVGTTGRGTYYRLADKGDIKGTKGTSRA